MKGPPNHIYLEALQQRDVKQGPVFSVPISEPDCHLGSVGCMLECSSNLCNNTYTRNRNCCNKRKVESDSQGFWLLSCRKNTFILYLSRLLCCRQMKEPVEDEKSKVQHNR